MQTPDKEEDPKATVSATPASLSDHGQARAEKPDQQPQPDATAATTKEASPQRTAPTDGQLLAAQKRQLTSFLAGEVCLTGGISGGWWQHEVCFGGRITHYHEVNCVVL